MSSLDPTARAVLCDKVILRRAPLAGRFSAIPCCPRPRHGQKTPRALEALHSCVNGEMAQTVGCRFKTCWHKEKESLALDGAAD